MKFSYVALNNEYNKVTGLITAQDLDTAKQELHKMGLSVLNIEEDLSPDFEPLDDSIRNFWFLARDEKGKDVSGTIEATDRKNALRRLMSEYNFEVLSLCLNSTSEDERQEAGKKGLRKLEKEVCEEFEITPIHYTIGDAQGEETEEESEAQENAAVANKNFLEQRKQILEEVDSVTNKAEEILEKYKDQISTEEFRSIQNNLDTLLRIKMSNNITYIQNLSEELYKSIHTVIAKYENPTIGNIGALEKPVTNQQDIEDDFYN